VREWGIEPVTHGCNKASEALNLWLGSMVRSFEIKSLASRLILFHIDLYDSHDDDDDDISKNCD
jgi:hypothetical protein